MTITFPVRSDSVRCGVLAAAILGFNTASSQAAPITWGAAQNISAGPTGDLPGVSITGTLVGAFNVGNTGVSSTTVNGVLFSSFAIPNGSSGTMTLGNFSINGIFNSDNATFGFPSPPFSVLSASSKTLLASAVEEFGTGMPNSFFLRMTGLSIGTQYQFQWWANDSETGDRHHTAWEGFTFSGNSVTLDDNRDAVSGGLGQFAIGTFTADATSEAITFGAPDGSGGYALLNAFQLRQIPVPEPSAILLCGCGIASVMGLRPRSRKTK